MKKLFLTFFFTTMLGFTSVQGIQAGTVSENPQGAVESFFKKINEIKFPVSDAAVYEKGAASAMVFLDVPALAQKSLGSRWSDLSADEQKTFVELLGKLINAIAYPKAQKFLSKQSITYGQPRAQGGAIELTSTMKALENGLEMPVVYYLAESGTQWKISDIFLDGISMTEDLQYQFDKIIKEQGPAELLTQMRARLIRAESENAA